LHLTSLRSEPTRGKNAIRDSDLQLSENQTAQQVNKSLARQTSTQETKEIIQNMQEKISDIYIDGKHYDQLFADGSEDFSFWISQAEKYGESVLELACGTGRITIFLAKAGFKVAGIDIADGMLDEAKEKSEKAEVEIEWAKGDMRDFNLEKKFSLIILAANALCHLLSLDEFESCMSAAKNHLTTDGRFVIEVFVPKNELLINKPGERFPFSKYEDPDGRGRIVVTESYEYESDTQIKRIKTYHSIPGEDSEIEGELNMRMYFPQELDALLKYNGFVIENKYGSGDQREFDKDSETQFVVCRMAKENTSMAC
jgi:2-polyprenyl-3-methyl-5-hydroxy-6-metoxy-1,4-benzoquinol methylase